MYSHLDLGLGKQATSGQNFNYRFVSEVIGFLCLIQVVSLCITILVSLYYKDDGLIPLCITTAIMGVVGLVLTLLGRRSERFNTGRREGMVTVSLSWFVISLIGMLPYYIGGFVPTIADAFFETISGFTTTGASVFSDIESLPKSILLWRAITQGEGGIGIIVFMVAIIPMAGENAGLVFNSEASGVLHDRFVPRIGVMAKWLTLIYIVANVLCTLLLWAGPMDLFDAVCHSLTCISTGGFGTKNNSLAYWDSSYINLVLGFFMLIGATSFTLLYLAFIKGDFKSLFRNSEFKWFIALILILSIAGTYWLWGPMHYEWGFWEALEKATIQIISLISSTGYAVADYSLWGNFFIFLVAVSMFIAGCSGSTSGGLKVARFELMVRSLSVELLKRTHPNAVISLRVGGKAVNQDIVLQVMSFTFAYFGLMVIGTAAITFEGYSFTDASIIAISCLSNSGGGVGEFSPMIGVSSLSGFNKVFLSIFMITGRLEIFTLLTILHRSFWKK